MTETPGGPVRNDDDLPLSRAEADAQRAARVMPLFWLGLGAIVVLIFALLLLGGGGFLRGKSAAPGPTRTPGAGSAASLASGARPR